MNNESTAITTNLFFYCPSCKEHLECARNTIVAQCPSCSQIVMPYAEYILNCKQCQSPITYPVSAQIIQCPNANCLCIINVGSKKYEICEMDLDLDLDLDDNDIDNKLENEHKNENGSQNNGTANGKLLICGFKTKLKNADAVENENARNHIIVDGNDCDANAGDHNGNEYHQSQSQRPIPYKTGWDFFVHSRKSSRATEQNTTNTYFAEHANTESNYHLQMQSNNGHCHHNGIVDYCNNGEEDTHRRNMNKMSVQKQVQLLRIEWENMSELQKSEYKQLSVKDRKRYATEVHNLPYELPYRAWQ